MFQAAEDIISGVVNSGRSNQSCQLVGIAYDRNEFISVDVKLTNWLLATIQAVGKTRDGPHSSTAPTTTEWVSKVCPWICNGMTCDNKRKSLLPGLIELNECPDVWTFIPSNDDDDRDMVSFRCGQSLQTKNKTDVQCRVLNCDANQEDPHSTVSLFQAEEICLKENEETAAPVTRSSLIVDTEEPSLPIANKPLTFPEHDIQSSNSTSTSESKKSGRHFMTWKCAVGQGGS